MVATQALVFGKRARSDSKIGESLFNTNHLSVILSSPPLNENHHLHFPNNLCGDTCTVPCLEMIWTSSTFRSSRTPTPISSITNGSGAQQRTQYSNTHPDQEPFKLKRQTHSCVLPPFWVHFGRILRWRSKIAENVRKRSIFPGVDPGAEH